MVLILGIESTCDEMACAVVRDGREILSSTISSQADLHAIYGGVVPELACRRHMEVLRPVIEQALAEAGVTLDDIDAIAAARGPGLIGAILVGFSCAKSLAWSLGKPFVGVNHIEAHLYAPFMSDDIPLPSLGMVVSGGHTTLVKIDKIGEYELLGETIDDAVGEAFDKVARMLGLPYPGGPQIEKLAKEGNPQRFPLKAGQMKEKPLHFSFSGLKTAVLYRWKELEDEDKADLAASFQEAAVGDLAKKAKIACDREGLKAIVIGGGVANNNRLRELLRETGIPLFCPEIGLTLDNAAMIAGLAYPQVKREGETALDLRPMTRIPLE